MNISALALTTSIMHHDYDETAVEIELYPSGVEMVVEMPEPTSRVSFCREDLEALLEIMNQFDKSLELLQEK